MCGFVITGAKTKAHNKEQLGHLFRNIKSTDKSIMLGLVAGLRPMITTQLFSELQAAELWDLQFEPILSRNLDELKAITPINKSAIMKIAEDVYTSRHRTDLFRFFFSVATDTIAKNDIYSKADHEKLMNQFLMIIDTIHNKYPNASELKSFDDYQLFRVIDNAIKDLGAIVLPEIERFGSSTIRTIIYNGLNVILGNNYYSFLSNITGMECVIDDLFSAAIFSQKEYQSCAAKDFSRYSDILRHVVWDYKNDLDINQSKPTLESFDVPVSVTMDPVQVMLEEDRDIVKHHEAFTDAMNDYHCDIQRLNKVSQLNQQLIDGGDPIVALESLSEIFPNRVNAHSGLVTREYALEEFSETIRNIIEFIIRHIHKIIPILVAIAGAIAGYMIKRRFINTREENIRKIHEAHEKSVEEIKKELNAIHIHEPPLEEVITDPKDWKHYNDAKLKLHYEIDKLILNHAPGYTEAGIFDTVKAHFLLINELVRETQSMLENLRALSELNEAVSEAKTVDEVSRLARKYVSPIQKLREALLHEGRDMFPYTRKTMFTNLVHLGGHLPSSENNLHFTKLVNRDIYRNYPRESDSFWQGDYSQKKSTAVIARLNQPYLAHYDVYNNRTEIGSLIHDPLHQLAPFEELDATLKPDFTSTLRTLEDGGNSAQRRANDLLSGSQKDTKNMSDNHPADLVAIWPIGENGTIGQSRKDMAGTVPASVLFKHLIASPLITNKSKSMHTVVNSLMDVKRLYDRFSDISSLARSVLSEDSKRQIKYYQYLESLRKSSK